MKRYSGPRRYAGRARPSRMWLGFAASTGSVSATGALKVLQLQQDVTTGTLNYDPPEDLTLLRLIGEFRTQVTGSGQWTVGLTVQDADWTPSATVLPDNDKRILWMQSYDTVLPAGIVAGFASMSWFPPGQFLVDATTDVLGDTDLRNVRLDIAPKVRIEAGQALYLVYWEGTGTADLSLSFNWLRILCQRTQRRR